MRKETVYFETAGPENTKACVEIVQRLVNEGHRYVVVASTSGETGARFARAVRGKDAKLVSVALSTGFGAVCIGSVPTHGLETAFQERYQGVYPTQVIAETLWRFGQGVKVACEVVMMACDAGLIPEGKEILAVGGTMRGADSVLVIKSAASKRFLQLKVLEIVAKPREG
ncbi:MAG: hypothetical protein AMK75_06025 [Planctomycetes bacterium SM23_65]|nr:MAG: hypothetical protein AMK75_06025 [Planctomycetes bacterium SM23_65]